jgi:spermidine synthase
MSSEKEKRANTVPAGDDVTARVRATIFVIFFVSGACGLIYEVIWLRMLSLVFGTTVYAVSTVLAVFMAGLALGSYGFGHYIDKHRSPLKVYAALEVGIGLFAVLIPLIFFLLENLYIAVHLSTHPSRSILTVLRFILSFLVLLIPTTLMGGTLPVMSKFLVRQKGRLATRVGHLYFANTLGAVIGCFVTAYFLIQLLGVRETGYLAALGNLVVGFIALEINKASPPLEESLVLTPATSELKREPIPALFRLVLWAFALSGLCALAYEVLWTRILSLFIGSTVYAFSAMLSTFLCGLALGSLIIARRADKHKDLIFLFGILEITIGILCLLSISLVKILDPVSRAIFETVPFKTWWRWMGYGLFISAVLMFIPTLLFGTTFPVVAKIYTRHLERLGRGIGNIYSVNTIGAIVGSFLGGFILIPLIGVQKSILTMALLNGAVGLALILSSPDAHGLKKLATIAVSVLAFLLVAWRVPVDQPLVLFSPDIYRSGDKLLFHEQDADATVVVLEGTDNVRRLYANRNEAAEDSRWDAPSHKVIAHIPLLLHPNPKRALVIGFGMGVTSYAITCHDVEVDAVEISKGVINANSYFVEANHHILDNPLVHVYIDDGRNYVLLTQNKYDMISAGIIHPGVSPGSANFYSKDFYDQCKRILTPNGVMSQWVPLHYVTPENFRIITRTFKGSFPNATLWFKYTNNFMMLIGTNTDQPLQIDFQDFDRRVHQPKVLADLASIEVDDTYALLDSFMMGSEAIKQYVGEGPIHTDNRPYIEFSGGESLQRVIFTNLSGMIPYREKVWPFLVNSGSSPEEHEQVRERLDRYFDATQYTIRGEMLSVVEQYEDVIHLFRTALRINPADKNTQYLLEKTVEVFTINSLNRAATLRSQGRLEEALALMKKIIDVEPSFAPGYNNIGLLYQEMNNYDEALKAYQQALAIDPKLVDAHYNLAMLYANVLGKYAEAQAEFEKILEIDPQMTRAREALEKIKQFGY